MTHNDHQHDHGIEGESQGIALGFRIFEDAGDLYFAEAEIAAYTDDPDALGATLVFHKLSGIDPTTAAEDLDWPAWATDFDDELTRDEAAPIADQFDAILRQLSRLSEEELRRHLRQAVEESEAEE